MGSCGFPIRWVCKPVSLERFFGWQSSPARVGAGGNGDLIDGNQISFFGDAGNFDFTDNSQMTPEDAKGIGCHLSFCRAGFTFLGDHEPAYLYQRKQIF